MTDTSQRCLSNNTEIAKCANIINDAIDHFRTISPNITVTESLIMIALNTRNAGLMSKFDRRVVYNTVLSVIMDNKSESEKKLIALSYSWLAQTILPICTPIVMKHKISPVLIRVGMAIPVKCSRLITTSHLQALMDTGYVFPNTKYIRRLVVGTQHVNLISYVAKSAAFTARDIEYAYGKWPNYRELCQITNAPLPYKFLLRQWCMRMFSECTHGISLNGCNIIIVRYISHIINKKHEKLNWNIRNNMHKLRHRNVCDPSLIKLLIDEVRREYVSHQSEIIAFLSYLL
jgi:hypothetical protein